MKRLFLLAAALFAFNCIDCNSCQSTPTDVSDASVEKDVSSSQLITIDNVSFTLSSNWKKADIASNNIIYVNNWNKSLIVYSKENYLGTFDQFAIESIRNLRDKSVDLLESSSITINDINYVLVNLVKDNVKSSIWLTVKNGYGYSFSCGGPELSWQEIQNDCQETMNTLNIM